MRLRFEGSLCAEQWRRHFWRQLGVINGRDLAMRMRMAGSALPSHGPLLRPFQLAVLDRGRALAVLTCRGTGVNWALGERSRLEEILVIRGYGGTNLGEMRAQV